jgi:hypothetical protein
MKQFNVLTFELQSAEFVGHQFADEPSSRRAAEASRLEIVIDGRSLPSWWQDWERAPMPPSEITGLAPSTVERGLDQLRQLQGPSPDHAPLRAELYYCPACFDVTCGILTVELARTSTAVTWRAFGWKTPEQDGAPDALIETATPFVFEPAAYDAALEGARAHLPLPRSGPLRRWHQLGRPPKA